MAYHTKLEECVEKEGIERMKVDLHSESKKVMTHPKGSAGHFLPTKLQYPPVAPDILPRSRLIDQLNQGLQQTMTLISAPAGYGKSTLASRWVAACDSPSAWISLEESDRDLRMFLSYVLAAIRSLFPKAKLRIEPLLEASQLPSVAVLARYLLNDVHQLTEPFILVLDDLHRTHGSSVQDLLSEIVAYPSRNLHLVLLTRRDPAFPISRMRGQGQLTEIRAADLRFTSAEAAAFLNQKLKLTLDDATLGILDEKMEGWVTGLRLAGFYLRDQDDPKQRVQEFKGSARYIAEYLAEEVLSRQDPETMAFLMETSILDRFCAPLCQAVHSKGVEGRIGKTELDMQRVIDWLVESNIFVIPLDEQGYWFRYHRLFQDFLQNRLRKQTNAEAMAKSHMRASNWFAKNGLIDEAIRYALVAGDPVAASRIVECNRHAALNADKWHVLARWLDKLSPEITQKRIALLLGHAWIDLHSAKVPRIAPRIDRIETLVDEDSMEPALLSEINFFKGLVCYFKKDGERSLGFLTKAMEMLPKGAYLALRSATEYFLSFALHQNGQKETAIGRLHQGILNSDSQEGYLMSRLLFGLCFIHMMEAEHLQVLQEGLRMRKLSITYRSAFTETWSLYALGNSAFQMFDLDAARHHFSLVLENRYQANPRAAVDAMAGLVLTSHFMGKPDEADETIRLAQEYAEWTKVSDKLDIVASSRARLALLRGDIDSAARWQSAFTETPGIWMLFFLELPAVTKCRVLIAIGSDASLKEALERLKNIYTEAKAWRSTCWMMEIMVLQALASYRLGQLEAALETLAQAVAMAEPGGSIRLLVEAGRTMSRQGDPMTDLLERLNQTRPGHTFTKQVLDACRAENRSNFLAESNGKETSRLSKKVSNGKLTRRETEILTLLAQGCNNKEISTRLFIAQETVKAHLQNIYNKLDVRGRLKAVKKARNLGCIPQD